MTHPVQPPEDHRSRDGISPSPVGSEASTRIAELEAALRPFSEIDGEGDEDFPDHTKVTLSFGRSTTFGAVKLGDLRRARAALPNPPSIAGEV